MNLSPRPLFPVTGIVLAGGKSRRMGRDKAELPWGEGTLLTAIVDKLALVCDEIIIVGPQRNLARSVRWTEDRYSGKGPLAGLQAGLLEASFDSALVLACDMPDIPVRVLQELIRLAPGADMVIPIHSERLEPLCAWYAKEACLAVIQEMLAEDCLCLRSMVLRKGLRVRRLKVEELFPGVPSKKLFVNLNSPADYHHACDK